MIAKNKVICAFGFLILFLTGVFFAPVYSLWDDEANTALFALSVKKTGDTDARYGQNLIAFRGGAELDSDLKARYVSPLQYYVLAPFVQEKSPLSARLPFLCLTLVSVLIIIRRILKQRFESSILIAFFLLSIGLTSFLLFGLQSRYYALTFFFSVILADGYWFSDLSFLSRRRLAFLGLTAALLFSSNYLVGIAVLAALLFHAWFFRREQVQAVLSKAWAFLVPFFVISVPVFLIWNPLTKQVVTLKNTPLDRLNLFYRNVRDYNGGAFGSIFLLIAGLFLVKTLEARHRFRQYFLIFIVYLGVISLFSPQPVRGTGLADIRYLYPLILLSWVWTIDFWRSIQPRKSFFWLGLLIFSFSSFPYEGKFRFPYFDLIHEIMHPAQDPYRSSVELLHQHAPAGASVMSSLDIAIYPMMFSAPEYRYVGQIVGDFEQDPDFLVSYCDDSVIQRTHHPENYILIGQIPSTCREAFRPEIFLRSFGRQEVLGMIKLFKRDK